MRYPNRDFCVPTIVGDMNRFKKTDNRYVEKYVNGQQLLFYVAVTIMLCIATSKKHRYCARNKTKVSCFGNVKIQ